MCCNGVDINNGKIKALKASISQSLLIVEGSLSANNVFIISVVEESH